MSAPPVLDVRGLTRSYGARPLFEGVDLSVAEGEKVGVIGRNGSGKSTLFRILAGLEGYEAGTVALRRGTRVGFLPQEPEMDPERTILETAAEGRPELREALAGYHAVNRELAAAPEGRMAALVERQGALSARIEELGGWDWSHRVEAVLTRLGVDGWERPVATLSGGERRRVALARTLLVEPDLLLLDEPTNHLDADTVLWLEEALFDFPGAALMVTHDRYFLDRVVDRMIEISPHGLASYEGGYSDYLAARAEREERERIEEAKRVKLIEKELAWARRSPPARTGKQKARRERANELAARQRERERTRTGEVDLQMQEAPRLGRTILELEGVSKSYPAAGAAGPEGRDLAAGSPDSPGDGRRVILDGLTDRMLAGERIGVVGPNGAGKTTLLRIVVGEEEPDAGAVIRGENTRIGYYDQDRQVDPELSVARAVSATDWVEVGGRRMHLRAYLDRFLFPPHVHEQKVGSLSGGERNRVLLARLFLRELNLLVLDEPTNDLDLDTLRILEEAMEEFEGCVLVVTHDRFLLDKLATSLLVLEGDGAVRRHHGSWDSWLARQEEERASEDARRREAERARREARASEAREQARRARAGRDRLSYGEKRELEGMEERIAALEEEKEELARRLADASLYQEAAEEVAETTGRFRKVESELEALYERWMELEERTG